MLDGVILDGRYLIVREIGKGGMGSVCEAVHLGTDRRVAVKVILNQELARNKVAVERFQREARAAGRIDTQHIGQVLDTGVDLATGMPYLVMELLAGGDLDALIRRNGPLAPDLVLRIAAQACVGLMKAHEADVVHRDVKPANVFLARRDRGEVVVKLLDFGVAKVRMDGGIGPSEGAHDLTRTGHLLGSPLYMSPEQAKGLRSIDGRSDLWSLGITLYKALAGRAPLEHIDTIGQLILALCTAPPPPIQSVAPWVPPEVAAVLHRALTPELESRFQSAAAMLDAVTRLVPDGGTLHVDMLHPAPVELRSRIAPRFVPPSAPPLATAQTVALAEPDSSGGATLLLDDASSSSRQPPPSVPAPPATAAARSTPTVSTSLSGSATESPGPSRRGSRLPFVGLGFALAAGATAAAWALLRVPVEPDHAARPAVEQATDSLHPSSSSSASQAPTVSASEAPTVVMLAPTSSGTASASAATESVVSGGDAVSRLTELRRRFDAGKITKSAYDKERQKILDGM